MIPVTEAAGKIVYAFEMQAPLHRARPLADLYREFGPMVFRRCLSILKNEDEAEDGVQEVFAKLAAGLDTARWESATAYLWRMATNYSLNRLKRERRSVSLPPDPVDPSPDMEHAVVGKLAIETLFSQVSPRTRELAWYRWVDGLTWDEMALASGLSVSGVRKHLAQFVAKARKKELP